MAWVIGSWLRASREMRKKTSREGAECSYYNRD